ncbi:2Fe-2S iron-sulfur cluster-binding protein [Bacillus sp. B15-48]|uniref:2Fe-2S iron-sulfur cluster-binding protein n=1 Tax=Bacillus sp. B15-48 TaxID=1548601 RepID=UPI00193F6A4D|nr:2Fe-2S iron-sulfur cluster-binding protein [Bacillus sp. B15-48]
METFKIEVNGKEILVKENETILNGSIRQTGGIFVGCKGGACGMCKIKITTGETVDGVYSKSALPDEEYASGYRLACQSKPASDMSIIPIRERNKVLR